MKEVPVFAESLLYGTYWREKNLLHKWNLIFNVGRYFYEVYSNETNHHHNKI